MTISSGNLTFTWDSHWANLPDTVHPGYTHGVSVDRAGKVYVFNQSNYPVLIFEEDGSFLGTWKQFPGERFLGAHGMTLTEENGEQYFWLTDQYSGEVVKTTLDGETVQTLAKPEHPAYRDESAQYAPTWVAVSPEEGAVFVADGYGMSLIHKYDSSGNYLSTIDGTEGLGRFTCPHGIWIGRRPEATGSEKPVLYVTDRGNHRIQVFDLIGTFIKGFYQDFPCSFAEGPEGEMVIPDLHGFINIYDAKDLPIGSKLGDNQHAIVEHHGWPNVPHRLRQEGKFNSPHGCTYDAHGNIYIVEWVEDGRIVKLTREGP